MLYGLILACVFTLAREPQFAIASWYGADFHGRETSCGEIYDMFDNTFAHKELPPGIVMRFTCDDRTAIAISTDDGPYWGDREYDLSLHTFKKVTGNLDQGLAVISYEILGYKPRATMRWNRYGTGRYRELYRDEIQRFINGRRGYALHKPIQSTRTPGISYYQRQLRAGGRYLGHGVGFCSAKISTRATT